MDTKELLSIIRACAQHGVREFAQGELKLSFFPKQTDEEKSAPTISTKLLKPVAVPPIIEKRADEIAATENEKANIKEVEEDLDELLITSPLEYEERLASGELVDDPQVRH